MPTVVSGVPPEQLMVFSIHINRDGQIHKDPYTPFLMRMCISTRWVQTLTHFHVFYYCTYDAQEHHGIGLKILQLIPCIEDSLSGPLHLYNTSTRSQLFEQSWCCTPYICIQCRCKWGFLHQQVPLPQNNNDYLLKLIELDRSSRFIYQRRCSSAPWQGEFKLWFSYIVLYTLCPRARRNRPKAVTANRYHFIGDSRFGPARNTIRAIPNTPTRTRILDVRTRYCIHDATLRRSQSTGHSSLSIGHTGCSCHRKLPHTQYHGSPSLARQSGIRQPRPTAVDWSRIAGPQVKFLVNSFKILYWLSPRQENRNPIICLIDGCNQEFKRSDYLLKHLRNFHNLPIPHGCRCRKWILENHHLFLRAVEAQRLANTIFPPKTPAQVP